MKEANWFEQWFDSPYYHVLYENRSEEEADLFMRKLASFLNISEKAKALDVACGKGRHSKTLSKLGMDVTGIDLSKNNIAEARANTSGDVKFEVWDMRHTYRKNEFDFVFNLFSSFGYFDNEQEDYDCIHAFYESLKPGGFLILDYINTEVAVKNMKAREIIPRGDIQFHIQKRLEKGFIRKKIEFLAHGENYSYEEQLKVINYNKFEQMMHATGFRINHVFGDYHLSQFEPSLSPRLILVAQKL